MQTYQFAYALLALVVSVLVYLHTGRHARPRWKVAGKIILYVGASCALTYWLEHFSLMFILGHPALGLIFHTQVCQKHGIDWWTCEPVEKYAALQNKWAGGDF